MAPSSSVETNLNMGAQQQTFPYPTISKPLLSSNAFWMMSFTQTLLLRSLTVEDWGTKPPEAETLLRNYTIIFLLALTNFIKLFVLLCVTQL